MSEFSEIENLAENAVGGGGGGSLESDAEKFAEDQAKSQLEQGGAGQLASEAEKLGGGGLLSDL